MMIFGAWAQRFEAFDKWLFLIVSRLDHARQSKKEANDSSTYQDIVLPLEQVFLIQSEPISSRGLAKRRALELQLPKLTPLPIQEISYALAHADGEARAKVAIVRNTTLRRAHEQYRGDPLRILATDGENEFVFGGRWGFVRRSLAALETKSIMAAAIMLGTASFVHLYSGRIVVQEQGRVEQLRQDSRHLSKTMADALAALDSVEAVNLAAVEAEIESWITGTSATIQRIQIDNKQVTLHGYIQDEDLPVAEKKGAVLSDERRPGWKAYSVTFKGRPSNDF